MWIKCDDTLPETKKLVLLFIKHEIRPSEFTYYQMIGFYTKGKEIYITGENCEILDCEFCNHDNHTLDEGFYHEIEEHGTCDGEFVNLFNVTHWMPLPVPPRIL